MIQEDYNFSENRKIWHRSHFTGSGRRFYIDFADYYTSKAFIHVGMSWRIRICCKLSFSHTKKAPSPELLWLQKRYFQVRLQGLEPWTPWLRVRCSTNWAKGAYTRDSLYPENRTKKNYSCLSRPLPASFVGQALGLLVRVSSIHYCTSTSRLSTRSSLWVLTSFEWEISS